MWLPLKAVITTFCARGECSKNPHLLTCEGSGQEGPAGTGEGRWEQPQLSWRVMVWNGLRTSGEPCLRLVVPHWPKFHEARICHLALRAVETAPGPSSNVR